MDINETKQAAAVMIASETKNIQERYRHGKSDDGWVDCPDPDWDWDSFEYRIAPEPLEVEAWVHEDGRSVCSGRLAGNPSYMKENGWTLRRATIHPETK
jgi:hypothetical protein